MLSKWATRMRTALSQRGTEVWKLFLRGTVYRSEYPDYKTMLLTEAQRENNQMAASLLRIEKEFSLVRYHGFNKYLRNKWNKRRNLTIRDGDSTRSLESSTPSQSAVSSPQKAKISFMVTTATKKKLEEMGIGRPSTYAPTISTIQNRGYVEKGDREGRQRTVRILALHDDKIINEDKVEITGAEKAKLFPMDIAGIVTDFLVKHFSEVIDYSFTARVEAEFGQARLDALDVVAPRTVGDRTADRILHDRVGRLLEVLVGHGRRRRGRGRLCHVGRNQPPDRPRQRDTGPPAAARDGRACFHR